MNFRVPSNALGNIGEPLDYSQPERLQEDDDYVEAAYVEEDERGATSIESVEAAAGWSGTRLDEEIVGSLTAGSLDNRSGTPIMGASGSRRGGNVDASCGELEDVAATGEADRNVLSDEQVRVVSQAVPQTS